MVLSPKTSISATIPTDQVRPLPVSPVAAAAHRTVAAWLVLGLCLGLTLSTIALYVLGSVRTDLGWEHLGLTFWSIVFLTYPVVGVLVLAHQPANRIGWLLCAAGLVWIGANFAEEYGAYVFLAGGHVPAAQYIAWLGSFYPIGLWLVLSYLLLLVPTGQPLSRRWRPVGWAGAAGAAGASLSFAFGQPLLINGELGDAANPFALGGTLGEVLNAVGAGFFLILACGMLAVVSMVRRLQAVTGVERLQLKWIAFDTVWIGLFFIIHFSSMAIGFIDEFPWIFFLWALSLASLPVFIGIAVLRYRLFDIDVVINRTLVYLALTACVVVLYIGLVGGLGLLLHGSLEGSTGRLMIALLVTGIVAVIFQPLRDQLQRAVNRLLYGERDEPYAVLSRLGARLEATLAPAAVLPAVVETVAEALKLPYAAIALPDGERSQIVAATGAAVPEPVRMPLVYQHKSVGELLVAPRAIGEAFSPADMQLLSGLARQAGVAVHAVCLTDELQRARERLVATREEERRRLRRDLHDGLGSQLAALTVQAGAVRQLIGRDPGLATQEVGELQTALREAIADIRQLVQGLRPPVLDELGLLAALRAQIGRYDRASALAAVAHEGSGQFELDVTLDAPSELPPLPAAVEVAVYRIVEEALTNVVRHAKASHCRVQLIIEDGLRLTITDNGTGLASEQAIGVGLVSMRERAVELGGTCDLVPNPSGGTRVVVWLPLRPER